MATEQDLVGLGTAPELASLLGITPQVIAGAGTTQATATPILETLAVATASGSNTGVRLPTGARVGVPYFVISTGGTALVVYPPVGHSLNGTANGTGTFQAVTGMAIFIRINATAWYVCPTTTGTVTVT